MQNEKHSRPLTFGLTLLSAFGRLVPHAPNVTPLGGSCLFAGSRISGIWAYLLPLFVMIATDPIVGHAGGASSGYTWGSPLIYASFMINVWIGRHMVRSVTPIRVGAAAFLCSLQFFVLSDFAVWLAAVARARSYIHRESQRSPALLHRSTALLGTHAGRRFALFRRYLRSVRTADSSQGHR